MYHSIIIIISHVCMEMTIDVLMYNVPVPLKLVHIKLGTIVFIVNIYY